MTDQQQQRLVIDLHDVRKRYRGNVQALRGIDLQVHPGETFGLLGPNGAGKSTLVKILMTVVRPSRAAGTVLGRPIGHKSTLARVGYLPEHHRFPSYLTGHQVLDYFGAIAQVPRRLRRRRASELLEMVRLTDAAGRRVGTYSKGMQQRLGLAQALIGDPELIVLDEPTDGLDPIGRKMVRELLCRLRDENRTVFINSHLLGEVEQVCDRVAILNSGQVVQQGRLDELTAHTVRYVIEYERNDQPTGTAETLADDHGQLAMGVRDCLPGGLDFELGVDRIDLFTEDPKVVQPVIDLIRRRTWAIKSVRQIRKSLEELFFGTIGDDRPR